MALTAAAAFEEFLRETVNLRPSDTDGARKSRDWLITQLHSLPNSASDFPLLGKKHDIAFGSFARKTQIRPLNDVDLVSCLNGTNCKFKNQRDGSVDIIVPATSRLSGYCHDDKITLNSTRILNRYAKALSTIPQYKGSPINRRGEAVVLQLNSYPWNFDIVPGFVTAADPYGRSYYLIPDGQGNWKKTDPRRDRDWISKINQAHGGNVLNVIRAMKYWNARQPTSRMSSYLCEVIVASYYASRSQVASSHTAMEIVYALHHTATAILNEVADPKDIEGNLNRLQYHDRLKIRERAIRDTEKAESAWNFRANENDEHAINTWREIFGDKFPRYQ